MQMCSNMLLRMQWVMGFGMIVRFGEKQPIFPLPIIQSILLESSLKLSDVTIHLNEKCIYSNGVMVKEYKELCDEELVKNELRWGRKRVVTDRVNIMVGTGTTRCEGLTTEWNDRILKRFEVFCSNCKLKKEEKREEKEAMKKAKADIVFSI